MEVSASPGQFKLLVVGLPDAAVRESIHRVTSTISNSGYFWPRGRVTVNPGPPDVGRDRVIETMVNRIRHDDAEAAVA